jgi:hypothetical protein
MTSAGIGDDAVGEAIERIALPQRGLLDDPRLFGADRSRRAAELPLAVAQETG